MAEDAFVTDFEHIMADDITENVRFIMYDSASGKTASAGEVSKYMMRNVHVDTTLTEEGSAAEAKAVGEALANKADTKGRYEDLIVGGAEQLMADGYETDKEPYLFRPTGGSADVGNREYLDKIVGGTVAWNQLFDYDGITLNVSGLTIEKTDNGTYRFNGTRSTISTGNIGNPLQGRSHVYYFTSGRTQNDIVLSNSYNWKNANEYIVRPANEFRINLRVNEGTYTNADFVPQIFDLTAMFGTTIADYIYSLEQATAGAGVAWFRNYFPKDYYPYDHGTLRSVEGVSAHETVGFNQWDEEWESGSYAVDSITKKVDVTRIRTKNVIPVLPSTTYYAKCLTSLGVRFVDANGNYISSATPSNNAFTTPNNASGMLFSVVNTTTYNHDICINLSDPTRNGEYEPYQKHTYPLDSSLTLRGVPKLVDGKLAFDGDVYPPSGEVQRRYGLRAYQSGDESLADAITDGTNTVYKLATPTTETADGYEHYQICDPSGTEKFVTDSIVPVGHETRYPHDLKKKLETAPDSPTTDGTYLMKRSGGKNTYMALPSTPSANGAYVLTVTVSGGNATYSWTAKE